MADSNGALYLNLVWHQHQPLYLDPELDQLQGPWVRTHGTKDYYDMAAILRNYPNVHATFNLTSSLLQQLQTYYVDRLGPFADPRKNRFDREGFLSRWKGKTDPWVDLLLKDPSSFDSQDMGFLVSNPWNALYITDVMMERFPGYKALKGKAASGQALSEQDIREIKSWFFLAYFDPDFLNGRVTLIDGTTVDLTGLIERRGDGSYALRRPLVEEDCATILLETYKVLSNIIPVHKSLMYDPRSHRGQIQIATTPYYHPILPLILDSDEARVCQPSDPLPRRFSHPEDADAQVAKAVVYFKELFGRAPLGMWPAEGSVSQGIAAVFGQNGIQWIAADEKILARSFPPGLSKYRPYRLAAAKPDGHSPAIVFRDTELSDKIGFTYQHYRGEDAAKDFIASILQRAGQGDGNSRLLTVVLDGENAWEWYRYDNDGKDFLHSLYRGCEELYASGTLVTVTMSEYVLGNPYRNVPRHPVSSMELIESLHPGSWINANFDTWIGSDEKNRAWEYLSIARDDLERSGVPRPRRGASAPKEGTKHWFAWKAWEELYAAEGSDWFWWYGTNQGSPSVVAPFDKAFLTHVRNIYHYAGRANGAMPQREFGSITPSREGAGAAQGPMVKG